MRWLLRSVPVVAVLAVATVGLVAATGDGRAPVPPGEVRLVAGDPAPAGPEADRRPTPPVAPPTSFLVADAAGPSVDVFAEPGVPYEPHPTMANPTHEGLPVVFAVLEEQAEWLRVRVSMRPNGLVAWVQREQVTLRTVPNRVVVEVGAGRVTVLHGDEVLLEETASMGSDRTPTPLGEFFVDGIVELADASGPYGSHQVSVSGFSEVLESFGGGVGQIALHGTNRPELVGQPVSNGCVRLDNDAIARLADLAPLGTPVTIVA